MPSVRLSSEALKFLKQAKNQNSTESYKPFVSVVHDEDESDVDSEDEEAAVVLTPRLKAHSRRIVDNFADGTNPCIKELQPIPVSNLSKRFSSANLGTPTRILQLALEKKSGNESHDHETTADEQPTSNSDTENEAGYSKNEVPIKQPAAGSRKKNTKGQEANKAPSENEPSFRVPREPRAKKHVEPSDRQAKTTKSRGKKKQREVDAEPEQISAPNDHFEPQVAKVSRKKPRQGPKVKENLRKPVAALMSPAELAAVKVTVENVPIAGTRRDVSLHDNNTSNVSRITTSVEDTIDSVVGTIGENEITSVAGRDLRSSRSKKTPQKQTEIIDNMPLVNTRKGRPKKAETSPTKRPARNKRGGKIPLASPAQDENSIMPGVMMQNDEPNNDDMRSDLMNPIVPDFSSDHEEDRTLSVSSSRDSPILSKSNRLSNALENKSPSSDSSDDSPRSVRRRLSAVQSRSRSSSPDMFTATPHKGDVEKQQDNRTTHSGKSAMQISNVPKGTTSAVSRTRRRASIGALAKASLASDAPPTPSSSGETTPPQLEAVGLVRKSTPQSASEQYRTPPRRSLPPLVTTPLSSRSRAVSADKTVEPSTEGQEHSVSLKRKQTVATPKSPPKRQRVQSSSPKELQEPAMLVTPKSSKRQRVRLVSPEPMPGPPKPGTPKSTSKRQRVQNPSPQKLPEPVNISTEETLPCSANADLMEFGSLGVKSIPHSTDRGQHSDSRRAEESASELTIVRGPNTAENAPLIHPSLVETARFNPYLAPPEDPVRASLLLSTDEYRVTWLHILPKCSFYFRVYSPTVVMLISGIILITGDANQSGFVLSPKTRVAELNVGSLCQAINSGSTRAIFQITESLS